MSHLSRWLRPLLLLGALIALGLHWPIWRAHWQLNLGLLNLAQITRLRGWEITVTDSADLTVARERLTEAQKALPASRAANRNLGFALLLADQPDAALDPWQATPELAAEFAQYGEVARRAGRYPAAYLWFGRAWQLAPQTGDYALFQALAAEKMGDWPAAIAIYRQALAQPQRAGSSTSQLLYRLGQDYQLHLIPPDLVQARAAYERALAEPDFSSPAEQADAYYHLGEIQQTQGDIDQAIESFKQATTRNPQHYWAQLRLAQTLYAQNGNVAAAVTHVQQALAAWPEEPSRHWPYQLLGAIYQQAGQTAAAIEAYEAALRYNPDDAVIRNLVQTLRRLNPGTP